MRKTFLFFAFVTACFTACRESYIPEVDSLQESFLVVEGNLDPGPDSTIIRLTRTFRLDDAAHLQNVENAVLTVEGADNSVYSLVGMGSGLYAYPGLNIVVGNEYRLRIRTVDGKEYLSEYVAARKAPPIDSVGWRQRPEGVRLYANAHDVSGNTQYYRWDYDETWEIRSYYYSYYIYQPPSSVRPRLPGEEVSTCWKYNSSSRILLGYSDRLQSDVIFEAPVELIPTNDERLSVRYSILVRQYALDKPGYDFYTLMKKNTEQIGTVFDPQPSVIEGNIHCVSHPGEPVIGYIGSSTVSQKRIFISNAELSYWRFVQDCPPIIIRNDPDSIRYSYQYGYLSPYDGFFVNGQLVGYLSSYQPCVECTARGGSLIRPDYW